MDEYSIPDPADLAEESKGFLDYPRINDKTDDWDEFYTKKHKHFKEMMESKNAYLKKLRTLWRKMPANADARELAKVRACCNILSWQVKKIRGMIYRIPSYEETE